MTDEKALRYEHITYFPFGETWVQESNATWRVPYQFTSKEMDPETGLYYFGARYYDPRTSVWQSADPILSKYLDGAAGGVYESSNFAFYSYGRNSPVVYRDPDGNIVPIIMGAIWLAGAAITAYDTYHTYKTEGAKAAAGELAKGAVITAVTGGTVKLAAKGFKMAKSAYEANKGVNINLKFKSGWSEAQKQAACDKCRALTEADTVVTKDVERSGTSAADRYKKAGGEIPEGHDVDHVKDLQLGGTDEILNMAPLDKSVNRSLGRQIQHQIKDLPEGTKINKVTIGE